MTSPKYRLLYSVRDFLIAVEEGRLQQAKGLAKAGFPLDQPPARRAAATSYPWNLAHVWASLGDFADKMPVRRAQSSEAHLDVILKALVPYEAVYLAPDELALDIPITDLHQQPEFWSTKATALLWAKGCDISEQVLTLGLDPDAKIMDEIADSAVMREHREQMARWLAHGRGLAADRRRTLSADAAAPEVSARRRTGPRAL